MADLIIQSGKHKGKRLSIPSKDMVVGRDDDCELRIASSLVSRKHCVLKSSPEGISVTDLASQNGTFVNDIPITEPTLMREGDVLRIGATLLAVPASQKSKMILDSQHNKISDDEIADWLTDSGAGLSGSSSSNPGGDTAVIASFAPIPATPTPPPPTTAPALKPISTKTLSVKDEAALIIKKHWETVKAKKKPH